VSSAGDVNADGFDDVIVGMPSDDSNSSAFLYLGSANGLSEVSNWSVSIPPNVGAEMSVSSAGDVNGDGFDDVIVGIPEYWDEIWSGAAFVYFGSENGLSADYAWKGVIHEWYIQFGYSVAGAGDLNGDGYDDVIIGSPQYGTGGSIGDGAVFMYLGSENGLSEQPNWFAESPPGGSVFGGTVSGAGDINADGYADILVGDSGHDSAAVSGGAAFAYYGSATGLPATPSWEFISKKGDTSFGKSVDGAGDVNADGYGDIIVGANRFDGSPQGDEGAVLVFLGSAGGLGLPGWTAVGRQIGAYFGGSVAGAGDVNGDGASDIVAGAFWHTVTFPQEGGVFVFHGVP
jgi:hypothetical protein